VFRNRDFKKVLGTFEKSPGTKQALTVLHKDPNRPTVPDNSACPISEQLKRSQKPRNYHKKMAGTMVYKSTKND